MTTTFQTYYESPGGKARRWNISGPMISVLILTSSLIRAILLIGVTASALWCCFRTYQISPTTLSPTQKSSHYQKENLFGAFFVSFDVSEQS